MTPSRVLRTRHPSSKPLPVCGILRLPSPFGWMPATWSTPHRPRRHRRLRSSRPWTRLFRRKPEGRPPQK